MAITIMAPRSSITANAVRNIFNDTGTLLPNNDKIPRAKAISVAMGIPAPELVGVDRLNARKIPAGTNMPPKAPLTGNKAFFIPDNSPA